VILIFLALTFDRMVGAVEKEAITSSEVESMKSLYPGMKEKDILQKVIEERIFFRFAKMDSIQVTPEEIEKAYNNMLNQNPGLKDIIARGLDSLYRAELTNQLYVQKLLAKEVIPRINITNKDIQKFYIANKESLRVPSSVVLHRITKRIESNSIKKLQREAEKILSLSKKEDFSKLVEEYSEDPSTKYNGGLLGSFSIYQLPPYFLGIDSLKVGETRLFTSPQGYHIIKLISRVGSMVTIAHIFLQFRISKNEVEVTKKNMEKVRGEWLNGNPPVEPVDIGEVPIKMLGALSSIVDTLNVGEVSHPIVDGIDIHLIKVVEKKKSKIPELSDVREKIRNYLFNKELEKGYEKLLDEAKGKVFYFIS